MVFLGMRSDICQSLICIIVGGVRRSSTPTEHDYNGFGISFIVIWKKSPGCILPAFRVSLLMAILPSGLNSEIVVYSIISLYRAVIVYIPYYYVVYRQVYIT